MCTQQPNPCPKCGHDDKNLCDCGKKMNTPKRREGYLSGSLDGHCKHKCVHAGCIILRAKAQSACPFCNESIGYKREFREWGNGFCHIKCIKRAVKVASGKAPIAFGKRLVELRELANLSRAELAQRLNVQYARLDNWEHGRNIPAVDLWPAIAAALGCQPSDLAKAMDF